MKSIAWLGIAVATLAIAGCGDAPTAQDKAFQSEQSAAAATHTGPPKVKGSFARKLGETPPIAPPPKAAGADKPDDSKMH